MPVRGRKKEILAYAARRDIKTTSSGIARAAGLSRYTMYRVLRGEPVSAHTAQALIRTLGAPGSELFDLDEDRA